MAENSDNSSAPPAPPHGFYWTIENGGESYKRLIVEETGSFTWQTLLDVPKTLDVLFCWDNLSDSYTVRMEIENEVVTLREDENYGPIEMTQGYYSIPIEAVKEEPVGGVFYPADRERLREQSGRKLTVFVVPLVVLIAIVAFAVWWRKQG